jgi:hypothetical protein
MAKDSLRARTAGLRISIHLALGWALALGAALSGPDGHAAKAPQASETPTTVIDTVPFGYGRPGELYLTLHYSMVSLDFIDDGHLLFTFQKKGLLRHTADEQPDDDDQLIHAAVVEIATGKEIASADWRMHDKDRYLWPLGNGRFLVRQRDTLSITGANLQLQPYGRFPGHLVGLQVADGGTLLVAETVEPDKLAAAPAEDPLTTEFLGTRSRPIVLRILRLEDRVVLARSRSARPVILPITATGFLQTFEADKEGQWELNFTSLSKDEDGKASKAKPFAEISSACAPTVWFLNTDTVMSVRCRPSSEKLATVLSLDGKLLWERKWPSRELATTILSAPDGSRFAHSTLTTGGASLSSMSDISGQRIEVYSTTTGRPLLTVPAFPVYDAGGNFAFSPDGKRFAVIHEGAIKIYDLPTEGN